MKKVLIIVVVAIFFASCGVSTPYDSFRKENKEDITFSLSASNFLVNMFVDDEDFKELNQVVSGISSYGVLVGNGIGTEKLERQFNKLVSQKGYESLMFINSDGARVGLYYFEKRNKIKEVIMKVKDDKDFVIISAEGNIKIKDIDRLMNKAIVELN